MRPLSSSVLAALLSAAALSAASADTEVDSVDDADGDADAVVTVYSQRPQSFEQIGSSVSVMTAATIDAQQLQVLDEALERLPGVTVTRSGGYGQNTEIRMRGFTTKHVLVMVDGVRMTNPAEFDGQFGIEHVMLDNIERIEVLRGPQSGVYGADATAGVINIITRRAGERPELRASAMVGTHATSEVSLTGEGRFGDLGYSASASRFKTGGISAASRPPGNVEDDGYENLTLSSTFDWTPSEHLNVYGGADWSRAETEIDTGLLIGDPELPDFLFQDSEGEIDDEQAFAYLGAQADSYGGRLTYDFEVSVVDFDSTSIDPSGAFSSQSRSYEAQYFATLHFGDESFLLAGVDGRREEAVFDGSGFLDFAEVEDDDGTINHGVFATLSWQVVDRLFVSLSGREDDNDRFGGVQTGRAALAYTLPRSVTGDVGVRLRTSYGTGREAPGLRQLLGRSADYMGNPDLRPEESYMIDAGVDLEFFDGDAMLSISAYQGEADNGIFAVFNETTFLTSPENLSSVIEMSGVEVEGSARLGERLIASLAYTNARAEVADTGEALPGRPEHELSFSITAEPTERLSVTLDGYARSDFYSDFPAGFEMDGYALANLAAHYDLSESVRVSVSMKNVFDKTYEEKLGDGTYGRTADVRVTATF